jgi:WD40 repeat protein
MDVVTCLAINRKDEVLVSGSDDATVVVTCVAQGERLHVFKEHTKAVTAVQFNSTETILATGMYGSFIAVWSCMVGYSGHRNMLQYVQQHRDHLGHGYV